jgi:hypothetical protein
MQGKSAGRDAGDPREVLRHELAHLALHEFMGERPPRWFDEGYASYSAREWRREDALATNLALAFRGMPTLEELDAEFRGGSSRAQDAYALAYRAVAELASFDQERGLGRLFENWSKSANLEVAVRRSYGMTMAGFEREWQHRTRKRYGMLALAQNMAIVGVLLAFIVLPFYIARRRRQRERLRSMIAADAAAEAAEAEALAAFFGEADGLPDGEDRPGEAPPTRFPEAS